MKFDIVKIQSEYFLNFGLWSALDRYYSEYFRKSLEKKDINFYINIM